MSSFGKNVRRQALVLGLLLVANPVVKVMANPLPTTETFSTAGTVGTTGVLGAPVVSFQGVDGGHLTIGAPFTLGQFVSDSANPGASTTYTNTPFQFTFQPTTIDGVAPSPSVTPVLLDGWLNGTIRGNDLSDLHVNFVVVAIPDGSSNQSIGPFPYPITISPFQTGGLINYLNVSDWGEKGAPIVAELYVTQAVPEPSSIAAFACVAGLVIRRCYRGTRTCGQSLDKRGKLV